MVGQNIGKYRVAEKVGHGGMGTVYRAVDETLQREVAIKVLNAGLDDPEVAKRFRAEAVTVARLTHPGIATIYELFEHESRWLMVMEFVRGETLEHMVSRMGPLSAQKAAEFCMQALGALAHAHSMGVVHRDLKPANLMITENGVVKIMDFGIARVSGTEHLTDAGFMMGTPAYMAPEQVLSKDIDARADLYSMGVVLYRLVTSKLPFDGDTAFALAQAQVNDPPTPVASVRPDLPGWVGQVLDRALSKSAEERFQSAAEFHEAFARSLAGLPMMAPYASSPPTALLTTPPGGRQLEATPLMTPAPARPPAPATTPDAAGLQAPAGLVPTPGKTPVRAEPLDETSMAPTPIANPSAASPSAAASPAPAAASPPSQPSTAGRAGMSAAALAGIGIAGLVLIGAAGYWLWPADPAMPPPPEAEVMPRPTSMPADIELPLESDIEAQFAAGAEVEAPATSPPAAAPPREAPTGRAASSAAGAPTETATSSAAVAPPESVDVAPPPAPPEPSPPPSATTEVPVAFGDVRLLQVVGKDGEYFDAVLQFADGALVVAPRDGGDALTTISYASITSATYAHARDPKWNAAGVRPPDDLDTPGTVFRRPGHWLVLQTAEAFTILRLEDGNWDRVVDTVEERMPVQVARPEGGDARIDTKGL